MYTPYIYIYTYNINIYNPPTAINLVGPQRLYSLVHTSYKIHLYTYLDEPSGVEVSAISAPYQYTADAAAGSGTGCQGNGSSSRSPQSVSSRFPAESVTPSRSSLFKYLRCVWLFVLNKSVL